MKNKKMFMYVDANGNYLFRKLKGKEVNEFTESQIRNLPKVVINWLEEHDFVLKEVVKCVLSTVHEGVKIYVTQVEVEAYTLQKKKNLAHVFYEEDAESFMSLFGTNVDFVKEYINK